uniref:Uncharacterized protein n=1 Tax=Rhizophora mucronata TaxID=61149 RepID=A0A2P2QK40_RHIMU
MYIVVFLMPRSPVLYFGFSSCFFGDLSLINFDRYGILVNFLRLGYKYLRS